MEKLYYTQSEIIDNNINEGIKKANLPAFRMALYGILAGIFLAIGSQACLLAMHNVADPGLAKVVAGVVFPIGLILIVMVGGQLFSGNCLLFMGAWDKKITWLKVMKNLAIIWVANMIGAVFIALLCFLSGQFDFNFGSLGAYIIKNAAAKASMDPLQAFISGILCNIIVCSAILIAGSAKEATGKILGVFVTIFVFVISGFEHCIANGFYLPAGILASTNSEYVELAKEVYHVSADKLEALTVSNALIHNLIPVTIGNVVGGGIILAGIMYLLHKYKSKPM